LPSVGPAASQLRRVQLKVCGAGNDVESVPGTPVCDLDPKEFKVPDNLDAWTRPIVWNQGGYDAMLLTSEGDGKVAVRAVLVTAGITPSLKLTYVESLLQPARGEGSCLVVSTQRVPLQPAADGVARDSSTASDRAPAATDAATARHLNVSC
jgi:hypothetical protein